MSKVVIDTNVLVSAFVSRGLSFDVIKDASYRHDVYSSEALLKEFRHVLSIKFHLSEEALRFASETLTKYFIKGITAPTVEAISSDPADNRILADALANECDLLVTGDKELLALKHYRQLRILSPGDYWKL